ncbi:pantoate--beta-alanine ligase [Agromyces atrinae]|uniref:Pantothenate synthetase n=1 Tax=Agromyces atrinae TaxID=592376 RepID=A0A4Q2M039_9MICO|nr:pantoate--beta-alanine ligase [Agromyces atrinae]NYD68453.1 pantoate--beta-alanine ligase [Agromyces atrinae]RXZ85195.1 pantoate--beta-alanine ligase [Agromyces atrinae]
MTTDAPEVVGEIAALRERLGAARAAGARIALVPTMGALHDGHLALVDRARELADVVVVSIFVNPLQFGAGEDLDRYPRTLDADVAALASRGVDLVFAPTAREMYPRGDVSTRITAGPVGDRYEGSSRPGHFDGMLTVVAKLLHIAMPDVALFGRKDAQQVFLVERMVADLDVPTVIEVVETVREDDGLALSSRNRFLDEPHRRAALALSEALRAASDAAAEGLAEALAEAAAAFGDHDDAELDYFVIVDPATLLPVADDFRGEALALVAARVGGTRLIDNAPLTL